MQSFAFVYRRDGNSPPVKQSGARIVPHGSVFGDWYAVEYDPLFGDADHDSMQPCTNDAFDHVDTVKLGWPAGPQPRA
jgi:hypothetical protein